MTEAQSLLGIAHRRQRLLKATSSTATAEAKRLWRLVETGNIRSSWAAQVPRLLTVVAASQLLAGQTADGYIAAALNEQGIEREPDGVINPEGLVGVASDGRPLDTLLMQPTVTTLTAISEGAALEAALSQGLAALLTIVATQVEDAFRVAGTISGATRGVQMYTRALSPPSCSRCVVLLGEVSSWRTAFKRHPRCLPAGAVVSGPQFEATTRRWYEGELVVLTTASGQELPLTGNHPVLTRRGWVPANLLDVGDEVVRSTRPEGATPLVIPDHHEMPSLIEDVWGSFSVDGFSRVPSSPEDFHGDGQHGQVDIADSDGALSRRLQTAFDEQVVEQGFAFALGGSGGLNSECMPEFVNLAGAAHSCRTVGRSGLLLPFSAGHLAGPDYTSFAGSSSFDARFLQQTRDYLPGDLVLAAQREFASPGFVGGGDRFGGQVVADAARWDAPGDAFSVESRAGYASRGQDLLDRLSDQVELDRIVELRRVHWSGHVYNLSSSEGWYSANNLIVSNCDCIQVPLGSQDTDAVTDPNVYFDSLSRAEQDRVFTVAGAQAIRDGADLRRVVNVRRRAAGLSVADSIPGARRALQRVELANGLNVPVTYSGRKNDRRVQLMPEAIYEIARDREHALQLLAANGYITEDWRARLLRTRGFV